MRASRGSTGSTRQEDHISRSVSIPRERVLVISVCGFASLPGLGKFQKHAACGVGFGWADNTPDLAAFQGWSVGGFFSAGIGANITAFVEGHDASKPDTVGLLIGVGAGFSFGPLGCKTWAIEL